jgi:anaerobic magnesium-protoporphyrin IX monomethyl ester cyclase
MQYNLKKVVLVRLRSYINLTTPPLGIGYLLKALEGIDGIKTEFIDEHRDKMDERVLLDKIRIMQPLILGFQVFSVDYARFRRLIPKIRNVCQGTKLIAGGPHISGLPEQTLIDNLDLDFVIKGEGEEALKLLAQIILRGDALDNNKIKEVPNLVYRGRNGIVSNTIKPVDVNEYSAPAWNMLEPDKYPPIQHGTFHKSDRVVPILTSRGCPYPCTFCAGHLITGKEIRRRNTNNIVDEIEFLQCHYGFKEFIIEDENFTFYKEHVVSLSNELNRRKIKCYFSLPNGIRLDKLDEEVVYYLKRMGMYMVSVGIESGSKKTLKSMKKNWDLDMVKNKIRLLKKNKIIVNGGFILGFSNETMKDIMETINFAIDCNVDTAYFGNYLPLPGSEDFNRMVSEGELELEKINWDSYTSYFGKIPFCPPNISEKDLIKAIRAGSIKFYCRPRIILNMLKRMTHLVFLRSLYFRIISLFKNNKPKSNNEV